MRSWLRWTSRAAGLTHTKRPVRTLGQSRTAPCLSASLRSLVAVAVAEECEGRPAGLTRPAEVAAAPWLSDGLMPLTLALLCPLPLAQAAQAVSAARSTMPKAASDRLAAIHLLGRMSLRTVAAAAPEQTILAVAAVAAAAFWALAAARPWRLSHQEVRQGPWAEPLVLLRHRQAWRGATTRTQPEGLVAAVETSTAQAAQAARGCLAERVVARVADTREPLCITQAEPAALHRLAPVVPVVLRGPLARPALPAWRRLISPNAAAAAAAAVRLLVPMLAAPVGPGRAVQAAVAAAPHSAVPAAETVVLEEMAQCM